MTYLKAIYKKSDFKKLSWGDYAKTLDTLFKKIEHFVKLKKVRIDAIVPILRGGGIPATYLAYKLGILRIIPIQYHYRFLKRSVELRQLLEISPTIKLEDSPTILIVEGNHCFGLTGQAAIDDVRVRFPGAKILYAADHMDYSYQEVKNADAVFFGKLTNETRALSSEESEKAGIENPLSYLFPWENLEEEYITTQSKQFQYKDVHLLEKGLLKKKM